MYFKVLKATVHNNQGGTVETLEQGENQVIFDYCFCVCGVTRFCVSDFKWQCGSQSDVLLSEERHLLIPHLIS